MSELKRREFCRSGLGWIVGASVGASILAAAGPPARAAKAAEPRTSSGGPKREEPGEEPGEEPREEPEEAPGEAGQEVAPAEDLMREHGLLNRILLIYDETTRRLRAGEEFDPAVLSGSAEIIRHFIEDYHEKLEENYLFPRFEKAHKLTGLVGVLRAQHEAGRRLTDEIRHLAAAKGLANLEDLEERSSRVRLADLLESFNRMYRPHEAREDTVLFPAIRSIVSPHEYDSLGEEFEDREHELFGQDGFEKMVDQVAGLERRLGIYDLAQFTPVVHGA